jgi:hypothetical protein
VQLPSRLNAGLSLRKRRCSRWDRWLGTGGVRIVGFVEGRRRVLRKSGGCARSGLALQGDWS